MEPYRRYSWLCRYLRRQSEGDRIDRDNREIKSIYREVLNHHNQLVKLDINDEANVKRRFRKIERMLRAKSKITHDSIYFGVDKDNKLYRSADSNRSLLGQFISDRELKNPRLERNPVELLFEFLPKHRMDLRRGGIAVTITVYQFGTSGGTVGLKHRDQTHSLVRFFYNRHELFDFKFAEFPDIVAAVRAKLFQNTMIGHLQYTEVIERVRKWQKSKKSSK